MATLGAHFGLVVNAQGSVTGGGSYEGVETAATSALVGTYAGVKLYGFKFPSGRLICQPYPSADVSRAAADIRDWSSGGGQVRSVRPVLYFYNAGAWQWGVGQVMAYRTGYFNQKRLWPGPAGSTVTIFDMSGWVCWANKVTFSNDSGRAIRVRSFVPDDREGAVYVGSETPLNEVVADGDSLAITVFEGWKLQFEDSQFPDDYQVEIVPSVGAVDGDPWADTPCVIDTSHDVVFDPRIPQGLEAGTEDHPESPLADIDTLTATKCVYAGRALLYGAAGDPLYDSSHVGIIYRGTVLPEEPPPAPPPGPSVDYALITVSWGSGIHLDVIAYWTDVPGVTVGWTVDAGNPGAAIVMHNQDNVRLGPEHITLGVTAASRLAGVTTYTFRVHFNFWGGSGSGAEIEVRHGAVTLNKAVSPSTNFHVPASKSDPYVTITFNAAGTPLSIV